MNIFPLRMAASGSFKRQIIATFVAGFLLLIGIYTAYLVTSERTYLYRNSAENTTGLAQSLAVSSRSWVLANDVAGLQEVVNSFRDYPQFRYAMVIFPSGQVLAHSDVAKVGQFLSDESSLALIKASAVNRVVIDNESIIDVAVPIKIGERQVGWARIALGREGIVGDLQRLILSNALFILFSSILALLASILIASRLGNRIESLVAVAEKVQGGDFLTRANVADRQDEITRLANGLNQMLDTLARNEAERKQAEEEIRRNEHGLAEAQRIAHLGNWELDLVHDVLTWSDEIYRILEIDPAKFGATYDAFLDGIHPDDRDMVNNAYTESVKSKIPYDIVHRLLMKDGRVKYVNEKCETHYHEDGKPLRSSGTVHDITERHKAQQEVEQLSLQNRLVLDSAGEGIYGLDNEGLCTFVNPAASQLLGFSAEEFLGRHSHTMIHHTKPDGLPYPEDECPVQASHKQGVVHRGTDLYWRKDGSSFPVEFVSTPILVAGKITGAVVAFSDITERKRAEEVLRRSDEALKEAQRIAHLGSWHMDLATSQVFWSEELYNMYGYDPTLPPPLYTESMKLFTPESWEKLSAAIAQTTETGIPYELELEMVLKEGSMRWMHARGELVRDEHGKAVRVRGVAMDITERKRAEDALRASNELLDSIIENIPHMIFLKNASDLRFARFNRAGELLLGVGRDKLIGKNDFDFFPKEQAEFFIGNDRAVLERGILLDILEENIETPQGTRILHTKKLPLTDETGRPQFLLGISEDITDRKRNDEELRHYKDHLEEEVQQRTTALVLARNAAETANQAKSVFLANMSHELRTPLNAILGFSSMMRKNPLLPESMQQNIDIINRSGEHLLTLINDVLEMAKIEAGRVQLENAPFDLGGMVRDVTDMMHLRAEEKGLQLLIDQASTFPRYLVGDEARLRQVLINLMGNAVKFTEQGGVTLRLGTRKNKISHLQIEVEDSGPGIAPEDQQRIFEPFVQLGEQGINKGTGLGLTITRQFVQLMGGSISLESTPGKGTVFRVDLPLNEVAEADIVNPKELGHGAVVGLATGQPEYRILIVEDQRDNQLLLTKLIESAGFQCKVAENGEQGVQLFQSWHPHFIWMDRRMPVMDGLEATRRIRELPGGKEVKIVAVTASAFIEQRSEMLDAGMDDFVRKPYRSNEIYECLSRQLGVKFIYEGAAELQQPVMSLTPEMLAVLPEALRNDLKRALDELRSERIEFVIQQVAAYDRPLQKTLIHYAQNFNYPAILQALGEN